jgi:hypothetical protein
MALDVMRPQATALKPTHATVPQLLALAQQDSDAVSCFVDGTSWDDAKGAILVVPDGTAAKAVYELLNAHGYLKQKPVAPAEPSAFDTLPDDFETGDY